MKKILLALAASTATLTAAAPALAQTAPTAPAGARVEALVGYDAVKGSGETEDGLLYGLGVGYDFGGTGTVGFGIDAEASDSTVKEGDDTASVKAGRDLYAGGRLNFALSDSATLYAKAGYTNAQVKYEFAGEEDKETLDGYRLGAGAQFGLTDRAYVGGEYRYSNYEQGVERHQVAMTLGTRF